MRTGVPQPKAFVPARRAVRGEGLPRVAARPCRDSAAWCFDLIRTAIPNNGGRILKKKKRVGAGAHLSGRRGGRRREGGLIAAGVPRASGPRAALPPSRSAVRVSAGQRRGEVPQLPVGSRCRTFRLDIRKERVYVSWKRSQEYQKNVFFFFFFFFFDQRSHSFTRMESKVPVFCHSQDRVQPASQNAFCYLLSLELAVI